MIKCLTFKTLNFAAASILSLLINSENAHSFTLSGDFSVGDSPRIEFSFEGDPGDDGQFLGFDSDFSSFTATSSGFDDPRFNFTLSCFNFSELECQDSDNPARILFALVYRDEPFTRQFEEFSISNEDDTKRFEISTQGTLVLLLDDPSGDNSRTISEAPVGQIVPFDI